MTNDYFKRKTLKFKRN